MSRATRWAGEAIWPDAIRRDGGLRFLHAGERGGDGPGRGRCARVGASAGTTSHYRLVVSTASGTGFGADRTSHTVAGTSAPALSSSAPLLCTRAIVLTDVTPVGRRVRLAGVARLAYTGQPVQIRAGERVVARATVRSDATFQTHARPPPRPQRPGQPLSGDRRGPRLAGAQAHPRAGAHRPAPRRQPGRVTGRLRGARGIRRRLTIERHPGCTSAQIARIATVHTRRDGTFTLTLDPPTHPDTLAVYRVRATRPATYTPPIVLRHTG